MRRAGVPGKRRAGDAHFPHRIGPACLVAVVGTVIAAPLCWIWSGAQATVVPAVAPRVGGANLDPAYIHGAICPVGGEGAAITMPAANTAGMSQHLKEISAQTAMTRSSKPAARPGTF